MNIGNEDEGTLVCNGLFSRNDRKGSPFLQVQRQVSIRDQSVSLAVRCSADEDPSKHGMTSVPFLSLDRRTPSPLGELWELAVKVTGGRIVVKRSKVDIQRGAERGKTRGELTLYKGLQESDVDVHIAKRSGCCYFVHRDPSTCS